VDIGLGVSMAPTTVRQVLVEGQDADGVIVEQDEFEVAATRQTDDWATSTGPDQVIAAIVGTWEGAAEGGYRLASTGVTWTDPGRTWRWPGARHWRRRTRRCSCRRRPGPTAAGPAARVLGPSVANGDG